MFILAQTTANSSASVAGSIFGLLVWLVVTVLLVVALWKIFVKAGQPGWASLIPIYNTVVMLRMTGHSGWWFLGMLVPFLNFFVIIRLIFNLASVFGRSVSFGFGLLFLSPIFIMVLAFGKSRYVGPTPARDEQLRAPHPAPTSV